MSTETESSRFLASEILKVNATLVDDPELSAPSYYRPVWPERGNEGVVTELTHLQERVANIRGKEGEILRSQYRTIDYLYGRREEAIDDSVPNPLVDMVCLLSTIGDNRRAHSSLQLAVEGPPVAVPYLLRLKTAEKPEQRTIFDDANGNGREARTISRFNDQITSVIRCLFVLGEASKHHPLVIESTLDEYSQKFAGGKDEAARTAMGLLEILHTLGLTYDERFYALSEQLRGTVLDNVDGYTELKRKFSYTVVRDRHFWFRGEEQRAKKRKMSYVKSEGSPEPILRERITFEFPVIENWQNVAKKRQEIVRNLRGLTIFNSIKATAVGFSEEKAIKRVLSDRLKKADLTQQKRDLERKEVERVRNVWSNFIEREVEEEITTGQAEKELLVKAARVILDYFSQDETLSQKAKTNIKTLGEKHNEAYYNIDVPKLAKDPLFNWVLALRNPYVRDAFARAITQDESSVDSFYLLLKTMAFDVVRVSLGKKELDFLFDPNYPQKIDSDSLMKVYGEIEEFAREYVPDIRDIAKRALSLEDSRIEDLLSPESLKGYRLKLENLTYGKILNLFRKDKSRAFTQEDKKELVKIVNGTAMSVLLSLFLTKGLPEVADLIAGPRARQVLEIEERDGERRALEERVARMTAANSAAREAVERARTQDTLGSSFRSADEQARRAAESLRFPGEISDRIPDAIRQDGDASERFGLTTFGRIYHFPENMQTYEGAPIGYFPWDINLMTYQYLDVDTIDFFWGQIHQLPPEHFHPVGSIDDVYIPYGANQLAYSTNGVNPEMYPPIGYRFVAVYQEGGSSPWVGPLGELYYNIDGAGELPARALFVLDPVEMADIEHRINVLHTSVSRYYPFFHRDEAERLTAEMAGDPVLQEIHGRFIAEISNLERQPYRAYTHSEYLTQYSEIGIRYAAEYARYTSENRFYALGFQIEGDGYGWDSLASLANQPENGYFCSVAAFAFRDFMVSAGFTVGNQPGITLFNHQGYLWGGMGHMNNIVFLPDGRVLEVDMTPFVGPNTPEEDLDFLRGRVVTAEDIRRTIEEINRSQDASQAPAPVDDRDAARRMVTEQGRARRLAENPNFVSDERFNAELDRITRLADELTTRELQRLAQQSGDVDSVTAGSQDLSTLRRIIANAQRVMTNAPSMLDIQLQRANPYLVYREYQQLEQIASDAASLRENAPPADIRMLDEISEVTQSLLQDMASVAEKQISEGRENAEYFERIQREYLEFYQRTGRYPGERTEEDRVSNWTELQRIRNARLNNASISDGDLAFFDEHLLEGIKSDLEVFINEMAMRVDGKRNPRGLRRNADSEGASYSLPTNPFEPIARDPIILLMPTLIFNRGDLVESLDQETRDNLRTLPSVTWEMAEMYAGESGLSEREQLRRAQEILAGIRRVDRAIEEYRFPAREHRVGERLVSRELANEILDTSLKLGVGAAALASAYLGLKLYRAGRKELKIIEGSFKKSGDLSKMEKDLVLSSVGHVCHLAYDKDFPRKAAAVMSLLGQYDSDKHRAAITWMVNEGADILITPTFEDSFYGLAELANGKARGTSAEEIMRFFPETVIKRIKRVDTHSGNGNGSNKTAHLEVPHDYKVIYGLSRMLLNSSFLSLHNNVVRKLGGEKVRGANSIPYKVDEFRELLREKYAKGEVPERTRPLVNTILFILWNAAESSVSTDELTIA